MAITTIIRQYRSTTAIHFIVCNKIWTCDAMMDIIGYLFSRTHSTPDSNFINLASHIAHIGGVVD
ncbi:hypothetical protein MASR1M36_23000 [Candidatus Cloacimonadaceae bacterium]